MATRTQIVIEGELVTKITIDEGENWDKSCWMKETRQTVRLSDWLEALRAQEGNLDFLPPLSCGHIVARQNKGNRSCVVVQLLPGIRSFYFSPHSRLYRVAMPYVIVVVDFVGQAIDGASSRNRCGIYMFYRNESVTDLDDELSHCNMPNVYGDGAFCWGGETIPLDLSLGRKIEEVVKAIFASHFNNHEIGYQWDPAKGILNHPQSFEEWERRSVEDPAFVLKLAWRPSGLTVRQALERGVK